MKVLPMCPTTYQNGRELLPYFYHFKDLRIPMHAFYTKYDQARNYECVDNG